MIERFALLTDFGPSSPYVGQIKLLLQARFPVTPVIDLVSGLPPFRPDLAAYLVPQIIQALPGETCYICVVDPGVGGARAALALKAGDSWFVGPDNGVLSRVASRIHSSQFWRIDWRPKALSDSFHGRDLFAPIAAKIAEDGIIGGCPIARSETIGHDWIDDLAKVVFIDVYGNLCTGIRGASVDRQALLVSGGRKLRFARTFSEVPPGEAFWYVNSFGLIELAVNQGRAEQVLGMAAGDNVTVQLAR